MTDTIRKRLEELRDAREILPASGVEPKGQGKAQDTAQDAEEEQKLMTETKRRSAAWWCLALLWWAMVVVCSIAAWFAFSHGSYVIGALDAALGLALLVWVVRHGGD